VLNPIKSLKQLIKLKADRLLTSGQKNSAVEGVDLIKELINIGNNRIKIMPGSGINQTNILEFTKLDIDEIHGSFSNKLKNPLKVTNVDIILKCIRILKQH
jgi:copper homeostasis protein